MAKIAKQSNFENEEKELLPTLSEAETADMDSFLELKMLSMSSNYADAKTRWWRRTPVPPTPAVPCSIATRATLPREKIATQPCERSRRE